MKGNYSVVNQTKGVILADKVVLANKMWSRMKGLLGTPELLPGHGLILDPCTSIHTFFMPYAIDVIFVDKKRRVVKILPSVQPWRLTRYVRKAKCVIELPAGTLEDIPLEVGDQIEWSQPE